MKTTNLLPEGTENFIEPLEYWREPATLGFADALELVLSASRNQGITPSGDVAVQAAATMAAGADISGDIVAHALTHEVSASLVLIAESLLRLGAAVEVKQ